MCRKQPSGATQGPSPAPSQRSRRLPIIAAALLLMLLAACQPTEPLPTPTPTRTPIVPTSTSTHTPTPTPTSTPTPTPTPTPTLPPGLILPPTPVTAESWPSLPNDLYFLRGGRLWAWLAEGGEPEALPMVKEGENDRILTYRLTPDGRYVAYATTSNRLYVFDRAQWQHTVIPTSGILVTEHSTLFEITDDGRYLIYVAWGVVPKAGARAPGLSVGVQLSDTQNLPIAAPPDTYGTVLALDLRDFRRTQIELGLCESQGPHTCSHLRVAQDGDHVAFADGSGVWVATLSEAQPQLLSAHPQAPAQTGGISWLPHSWSPDGRWLLLHSQTGEGRAFAMVSPTNGEITFLPNAVCEAACRIETSWGPQGIWVARATEQEGCLYLVQPGSNQAIPQATYQMCTMADWPLHPTSPYALPDGWVAFLHGGCGPACPGPAPGLYFLGPDERQSPIALLPEAEGRSLWLADGSAFLYLNAEGKARYIGMTDGSHFWDVTSLLESAHDFRWGPAKTATP